MLKINSGIDTFQEMNLLFYKEKFYPNVNGKLYDEEMNILKKK